MLKKVGIFIALLLFMLVFFNTATKVLGAECKPTDSKDANELQSIIDACNSKLSELGEQRNTLASQIEYMDTQIALTQTEIEKNQAETEQLKKEIKNLSSRITELNLTSDKVTEIVEGKIRKFYADNCLVAQGFVKEEKKSVAEVLAAAAKAAGGEATIKRFVRFEIG